MPYSFLLQHDAQVFHYLYDVWKIDLDYFAFNNVFNNDLVSLAICIDDFITDGDLLTKAK